MPERQILVKPIGLVTQPNKLGVFPPGAMSQAKDVIMRSPAIIQQAYSKTAGWSTLGQRPRLLYSCVNQLIALQRSSGGVWSVSWLTHALTSPTLSAGVLPYTSDDFSQTGRLQAITMRGRTIINGATKDPIVCDTENPTSAAERTFRFCGIPQPLLGFFSLTPTATAQALDPITIVTYAAVIKRELSDGYILQSAPSLFMRVRNSSGALPSNVDLIVIWDSSNNAVQAGDVVEIYRSQSVTAPTDDSPDPGTTVYLAASVVLTSAQVSANFINITDAAIASNVGGPLGGLGRELYTNPRFGGLTTRNDPPPLAACIASFRGRAWYANCRFGARLKIGTHMGIGVLTTDQQRLNGLGSRAVTGTWANGSANITGISASHILGLVPGQLVLSGSHPVGTKIVSVGATSIVVDQVAVGAGAGVSIGVNDVIEIDGNVTAVTTFLLSGPGSTNYKVTTLRTLTNAYAVTQEFQIEKARFALPATITVRATNGSKYEPTLPSMSDPVKTIQPTQRKNNVRYSHDQQPEAVPPKNELDVSTGEIYMLIPTRDALWFFTSEGVQRLSGTINPIDGIPDIRLDPIDSTLILAGPRAWCVLRDRIFAYTNRGFVAISDEGVSELTTGVIGDLWPGQGWVESESPHLLADTRVDEIYIMGAHATLNLVYSLRYGCFTTTAQFDAAQTSVKLATSMALVFGYASTALDELQPDLTSLVTSAVADYQPVHGNRPDIIKQWIDASYVWEPSTILTGPPDIRMNGSIVTGLVPLIDVGNDIRGNVGIPQDAPALSTSIAPGFQGGVGLKALSGISLRYATFTEQQGAR